LPGSEGENGETHRGLIKINIRENNQKKKKKKEAQKGLLSRTNTGAGDKINEYERDK